ncbi:hypothetical protein KIW84_023023 [Lathyrus oleraceus]|uniref:Uncharacterized protein n=1 Tax=Pisum sativum TaxID=3888 RepID=A0A9D5BBD6_PEA|nr:hypothetical protein KIW84_023023 [Pisum sativum]
MVLLKCMDRHEADILMQEVHEGSFGTYANGHAMVKKMLMESYYWMTMESDCWKLSKVPKPSSSSPFKFCLAKGSKESDSKLHSSKIVLFGEHLNLCVFLPSPELTGEDGGAGHRLFARSNLDHWMRFPRSNPGPCYV